MKQTLRYFLIAMLPVVAAAAISCKDDDNWKPTWALPLVKEQTIRIGDFITDSDVKKINNRVRQQWTSYVADRFGNSDTTNVDSTAYCVILVDSTTYVTFDSGYPALNDSTEHLIRKNLTGDPDAINAKIAQINQFLKSYGEDHPNPPGNGDPSSNSYGGNTAINSLLDAMIHPTDVFITAANVLSAMGNDGKYYVDSIRDQIDTLLLGAQMTDSIPINFADYVPDGEVISSIELDVTINSSGWLPFYFNFGANFVGANSDSICAIFSGDDVIHLTNPPSPHFGKDGTQKEALDDIVKRTQFVKFSAKCGREPDRSITENVLRTLSDQGISFSVRVKVQAAMSKFTF
ncbi:MAG: hypothetical protein LBK18_04720 [Prevotellaceae bacterium]|jgi:hypothetical protein|nr:hypothetical protein [Prevotellaceae bacterium]